METLDLTSLIKSGTPVATVETHLEFDESLPFGEVACKLQVKIEDVGVLLRGSLSTEISANCDRCLNPFIRPIEIDVDERYVFSPFVKHTATEKELLSDDFFEEIDPDGELNLKDMVYQLLVLEMCNHQFCNQEDCQFLQHQSE